MRKLEWGITFANKRVGYNYKNYAKTTINH